MAKGDLSDAMDETPHIAFLVGVIEWCISSGGGGFLFANGGWMRMCIRFGGRERHLSLSL